MYIFKRPGSPYHQYEFVFRGKRYRGSTNLTNAVEARNYAGEIRSKLVLGEVGIKPRAQAPTVAEFIATRWTKYVTTNHAAKSHTVKVYLRGAKYLLAGGMGDFRLDEITNLHTTDYFKWMQDNEYAVDTINMGIKALRRMLSIAVEGDLIESKPELVLLGGAVMREDVLAPDAQEKYLAACTGVWHTIALTMLSTGMRPGEVTSLRWEAVDFEERGINITKGKSKNARRRLPMLDRLYDALRAHWEAVGKPQTGLVFPSKVKKAEVIYLRVHQTAVKRAGLPYFVPYVFRHTALTELAKTCDPFTLMKIAGHSSIVMTMRYIHPQKDAVIAAFGKLDSKTPRNLPHIVKTRKRRAA